jgi:hypothetical protein
MEQPVKDSERQLSGMVVDEDTRDALVQADMSTEQLRLIDAILTLPEKSLELEVQRRITAINAVTVHCGVEEGTPSRHVWRGRPVKSNSPPVYVAKPNVALCQAIFFIKTNKRLIVYFYYIRNPSLLICNKVANYITSSSSS